MPQRSIPAASLSVLAAQVSINLGAAIGKGLFGQVGPEGVAALRTSIAAIILLLVTRACSAGIRRYPLVRLVPYGLSLGAMNLLIYWAIERIPIGLAVTIEISGPLALVLCTSRSVRDFGWFVLALSGLLLLMPWPNGAAPLDPLGVACAFGAAGCWALYILFGKRASQMDSAAAVTIGMVIACMITVPVGLFTAGDKLLDPSVLPVGLVVAVLSSALPYFLEMTALQRLSARTFGVVTSSAPAIAALVGFFALGERLTAAQWIAVAMVMAASVGCSVTSGPAIRHASEDTFA